MSKNPLSLSVRRARRYQGPEPACLTCKHQLPCTLPQRIDRLPEQYFGALLGGVTRRCADGEPSSTSVAGTPRPGRRHVVERSRTPPAGRRARVLTVSRPARVAVALADRYRVVYGVALDPDTEVAVVPGTKTAIVELSPRARRGGADGRAARPVLPGLPVRAGARRRRDRLRPARPGERLAARLLAAPPERRGPLPELPVQPGCGRRAGRGLRGGGRLRAATGAAIVHDFAYGDLVFDGREPRASSPPRARRRSGSRCSRCPSPTAWPAGGSASSSATRRSSSGSTCSTTTAASGSSGRSRRPASRR